MTSPTNAPLTLSSVKFSVRKSSIIPNAIEKNTNPAKNLLNTKTVEIFGFVRLTR